MADFLDKILKRAETAGERAVTRQADHAIKTGIDRAADAVLGEGDAKKPVRGREAAKPAAPAQEESGAGSLLRGAAEFIPGGKLVTDLVDGKGVTASGVVQTVVPGPLGTVAGRAADKVADKVDTGAVVEGAKAGAASVGAAVSDGISAAGSAIQTGVGRLAETFTPATTATAPAVAAATPTAAPTAAASVSALDDLASGKDQGRFDQSTYQRAQAFLAQNTPKP
ncbi:MAG: hypothetical protein WC043_02330 [Pseudobdellovibrionaceae bacterium]